MMARNLKTCKARRSGAESVRRLGVKNPSRRVNDRLGYFVLLKRSSTKVGSGVPGGRSGFTASLNQASC